MTDTRTDNTATDAQTKQQLREENRSLHNKINTLEREINTLKQQPYYVGTVDELLPNNHAIITQHGTNNEVVTQVTDDVYNELHPPTRVAIDNSLHIVELLPDETNPQAQQMQVVESPTVTYDDIGGLDSQLRELREAVEAPLTNPDMFDTVGIDPPTGVLLHGPPGTGKTLMVKAVANNTDATMLQLSGSDLAQKFIGDGSRLVKDLFSVAEDNEPAIIFIDEIDAIAARRNNSKTSGGEEVQRTLMQLLNEMDGFESRGDIAIIGATNRIDMLDDAVTRPGRLDRLVEVSPPDPTEQAAILTVHLDSLNTAADVTADALVDKIAADLTGADIEALTTEAGMYAIRDHRTVVTMQDFDNALHKLDHDAAHQHTNTGFA